MPVYDLPAIDSESLNGFSEALRPDLLVFPFAHQEFDRSWRQVEHFLLTPADLQLVVTCRGDANRYDMALAVEGAGFPRFRPREAGSHSRRGIVDEVASAIKRWVGRSNQSFESVTVDTLTGNLAPSTS